MFWQDMNVCLQETEQTEEDNTFEKEKKGNCGLQTLQTLIAPPLYSSILFTFALWLTFTQSPASV